jgi:hypothetical protein
MGVVKKGTKTLNVNVDHVAKQKKKKNLSNEFVYASINGIVEMFPLREVFIGDRALGNIIQSLEDKNTEVNKRLDTVKEINTDYLNRFKKLERKMKAYGIE